MAGKKRRKNRPSQSRESKTIKVLILIAISSALITILMISEGILSTNQGSIGLVIILSLIFLFLGRDRSNTSRRRSPRRRSAQQTTIQQSSDSSGGLTIEATSPNTDSISETPTTPKPQLVRAARRKREYVSYPINLEGGSYADTYLQLNKDTVLKLRSALWDGDGLLALPGQSISSLEVTEEVIPSSEPALATVTEASATITPAVEPVAPISTEAEVDSDFDFEWE
tara:strand:+ start:592 stop:1272 length:681 start_codon:yes stop_codon:yes gene_type:complete